MAMAIRWIWTLVKRQFSRTTGKSSEYDQELASAPIPSEAIIPVASTISTSISSAAVDWKYDVFLSFRGPDTRMSITSELYDGLQNKIGIKTFIDDQDLEVGDPISPTLLKAIEQSRFAIIVLSPNYAVSTWCLEELAKICECMKDDHNRILPLFYNVEPTDVRYQKMSFGEAFNRYEGSARHAPEKVQQWRDSLKAVASLSGWHTKNFKTDRELIDSIVEFVSSKVQSIEIEPTMAITVDFQAFEATQKAMKSIMKAFQDKEVTALGVYGMGGVGKTTMVKHVGAEACKKRIFNNVIVVVVSQSPEVSTIQQTFSEQLGFNFKENSTESGRASRLYKEILRKNNSLIILDDIWKCIDLSTIGIPTYDELKKCNSKILLTTRILHVCNSMRIQATIPLSILSDEDSWTLFATKARRSFESTKFNNIARKVARECKGLPIALLAVARALGDKDLLEWEKASQRLQKSQFATLDDEPDAYQCIKFSFDYLRDEDSKSCFLLCCLFPEDYKIKINHIFSYATGIGLFRDCETIYEARGMAESVVKYLKDSSLLLEDDDDTSVRMHDVIRDTAMNIAKSADGYGFLVKAGCGLNEWPRLLSEGYTAVSLMSNVLRKLPLRLVCPKLQILLLNNNYFLEVIPETFLQSLDELRVLDISYTSISILPQSFGLLTNLQSLYLDRMRKPDISMVGKLMKLEILSMQKIDLEELPSEIGDLANLRVLDISEGEIGRIPFKLISRLHSLEELYLEYKFCNWLGEADGEEDNANACFYEVTSLSKLTVLKAWITNEECIPENVELNPNWVRFDICIGEQKRYKRDDYYHTVIDMNLKTISSLPGWFFSVVMNIAECLEWSGCPRLTDIFVEYENGRLHEMRRLSVSGGASGYGNNSQTCVPRKPVLKNLEELELIKVDCQDLCVIKLAPGSLFSLRFLHVRCCYNWGNVLLPSVLLQRLENLEQLACCSMKEIEYLFQYSTISEPRLSKLRHIKCDNLATVRSICDGPSPPALFQNLQSLSIKDCCSLEGSLFTYDVTRSLIQLKKLELKFCPILERIVEATDKSIILPKLEFLALRFLPMLYYESKTMIFECPSLQHLDVSECPKFPVSASDFRSRSQVKVHNMSLFLSNLFGSSSSDEEEEAYSIESDREKELDWGGRDT